MLFSSVVANREKIRFHTPGHSRPDKRLLDCDVTELPYSDNLYRPEGPIKELETFLASAYRAERAFLSCQGATHNIFQSIYACIPYGAFLVVGDAHLSVYNALRVFSAKAYRTSFLQKDIPADVKTVIVTSPDYRGNVLPLERLYAFCRQKGLFLLVDSAHGAHFAFSSKLPVSASVYSDLAILSLHKTLPVITGGSVLSCKEIFASRAFDARKTLHTTSPSYMTMCSAELAVKDFSENGEKYYEEIFAAVEKFASDLKAPFSVRRNDDFSRLCVVSPYDGEAVGKALFDAGFVAETFFDDETVFIVTKDNYIYLDGLCKTFNALEALPLAQKTVYPFPEKMLPLVFGEDSEYIPLDLAEGRINHSPVGLYPPGSALLYPGETVTEEKISYLSARISKAFGLENGLIRVLK